MSTALFQQVVEATRGEYVLHGTLGQSDALGSAFLAHEVAADRSVVLIVPPDADSLDVIGALSDTVPANAGGCAACGFRIGTWLDVCPRCDHVLRPPAEAPLDVAGLREQLRETLRVVGSLPHVRGGTLYFGHEIADGRLTGFVIRPQADGQLGLDVVWEAVPETSGTAPTVPYTGQASGPGALAAAPTPYDAPAPYAPGPYAPGAYASQPESYGVPASPGSDGTIYDATGVGAAEAQFEPAPRRRWVPIGLGVGALALLGAAAFAFTRHDTPAPPPKPDSIAAVTPLTPNGAITVPPPHDSTPVGATAGTSVLPINNDSVIRARQEWRRRRDSLRAAQRPAILTIDAAELPAGWTVTVNGGGPTNARDVQIPPGGPAVIRIEAPGYCADTLSVNPAPRSHQHWAPILRGRPTVGEC